MAKDFKIEHLSDDEYRISLKESDLCAFFNSDGVEYCLAGCYNSGSDYRTVDLGGLKKLKVFMDYLAKE